MWKRIVAAILMLTVPAGASAGPVKEALEKAGRDLAAAQPSEQLRSRSRTRMWTGLALIGGGGVLAALGALEVGDEDLGADDGEDSDDSDDGEDSDGWGDKAMLGGGIAAAALGSVLLLTGRKSGPVVSVRPGGAAVRHTFRF